MKTRFCFTIVILLFVALICNTLRLHAAQSPQQLQAMQWVKKTPPMAATNIASLAIYLGKISTDEYMRALAAFTWVAYNIDYDWESFASYKVGEAMADQDAEIVLKRKTGVCAGYSDLLAAICDSMHLECRVIIGFAKGFGFNPGESSIQGNHAWNAIKIYGTWQLMDVTWASPDMRTFDINYYYFCASPRQFLAHHLPTNPYWQLLSKPMTWDNYVHRPIIWDEFYHLGFEQFFPLANTLFAQAKPQIIALERSFADEFSYYLMFEDSDGAQTALPFLQRFTENGVFLSVALPAVVGKLNVCVSQDKFCFQHVLQYRVVPHDLAFPKAS